MCASCNGQYPSLIHSINVLVENVCKNQLSTSVQLIQTQYPTHTDPHYIAVLSCSTALFVINTFYFCGLYKL